MKAVKSLRKILLVPVLLGAALVVDAWIPGGFLSREAEARAGRGVGGVGGPGRPVAGVARRTTRRCIRRTTIYVATLPPSCTIVVVEDASLHYCGGTYYQPYGTQYVVVNVD